MFKTNITPYFLFISLLLMSHAIQAQVYKCKNSVGEVRFSDEGCHKGESSSRLNWLKSGPSAYKKKIDPAVLQARKTARKAKKNKEAYVVLSLITTTQLELETATLRSSYNGESTELPELILPDGITVDLLKVDKIILTSQYAKNSLKARFIMVDGYQEIKILKKPYPVISGAAKIGHFKKSLGDIKKIEFFNSQKLLKDRADKPKIVKKKKLKKITPPEKDVPVIELDLSHEIVNKKINETPSNNSKPEIKAIANKEPEKNRRSAAGQSNSAEIQLLNYEKVIAPKTSLASTRGEQKSVKQYFIVDDRRQIPFNKIKQIKVRSMKTNSALLVAIELEDKEIKMEVMPAPYTHITGTSSAGSFDYSLAEIKSMSFQ